MAEKTKLVEVVSLRPHVERQRRWRDDKYFVKPERVEYLVNKGWAKPVVQVEAEIRVEAEAEAKAEAEQRVEEKERVESTDVDALLAEWKISISPEQYIERYGPDAKNSALAQAIIDKLAEA
jgi:hypothetical protein